MKGMKCLLLGVFCLMSTFTSGHANSKTEEIKISENTNLGLIGSEVTVETKKQKCSFKSEGKTSKEVGEQPLEFKIILKCGNQSQVLWDISKPVLDDYSFDEPKFELLAAGYFDKDDKLDYKLNMSPKYSCDKIVNYLSSKAKPGELIGVLGSPQTKCGE